MRSRRVTRLGSPNSGVPEKEVAAGCGPGSPGSEARTFASADQAHEPWLYWRGESYLPHSNCPEILVRYMPPEPSAVYSMKKVLLRISYQLNQLEASPYLTSASLSLGLCLLLRVSNCPWSIPIPHLDLDQSDERSSIYCISTLHEKSELWYVLYAFTIR
jgi:hypothetical protein